MFGTQFLPPLLAVGLSAPFAQEATDTRTPVIEPSEIAPEIGETADFTTRVVDAAGEPVEARLLYFSRNRRSVKVSRADGSGSGTVTALKPGTVEIVVTRRVPVALLPAGDGTGVLIDAEGVAIARSSTSSVGDLPVITLGPAGELGEEDGGGRGLWPEAARVQPKDGGGGVGLMGACARATHSEGGEVLGIMPRFLLQKERIFDEVPHEIVEDMHTRKQMMFDESDAFIVLPGGIGTLEEAVEILSWARLGIHAKPMAFLDEDGFWEPLFDLMDHIIDGKFTPEEFRAMLVHTDTPALAIQALQDRCVVV